MPRGKARTIGRITDIVDFANAPKTEEEDLTIRTISNKDAIDIQMDFDDLTPAGRTLALEESAATDRLATGFRDLRAQSDILRSVKGPHHIRSARNRLLRPLLRCHVGTFVSYNPGSLSQAGNFL